MREPVRAEPRAALDDAVPSEPPARRASSGAGVPSGARASMRSLRRRSKAPVVRASDADDRPARRLSPLAVVAIVALAAAASGAAVMLRWHRARPRPVVVTRPAAGASGACVGAPRTPTPGLYDDEVCVQGGPFARPAARSDDGAIVQPARSVVVEAFYIDRYEVTVARYRRCVAAGGCDDRGLDTEGPFNESGEPSARGSRFRGSPRCTFRAAPTADDARPITCLNASQAEQVCHFEGRRLPSELEWERAARGPDSAGRTYPWGDEPPDCGRASYGGAAGCGLAAPTAVGLARAGATPEGVTDLAGNVSEWTADPFEPTLAPALTRAGEVAAPAPRVDVGACGEGCRAVRGGSWLTGAQSLDALRSTARAGVPAVRRSAAIGVRCVRSR